MTDSNSNSRVAGHSTADDLPMRSACGGRCRPRRRHGRGLPTRCPSQGTGACTPPPLDKLRPRHPTDVGIVLRDMPQRPIDLGRIQPPGGPFLTKVHFMNRHLGQSGLPSRSADPTIKETARRPSQSSTGDHNFENGASDEAGQALTIKETIPRPAHRRARGHRPDQAIAGQTAISSNCARRRAGCPRTRPPR